MVYQNINAWTENHKPAKIVFIFSTLLLALLAINDVNAAGTASVTQMAIYQTNEFSSHEDCPEAASNEYRLISASGVEKFIADVNSAGKCRYRLIKVSKYPLSTSENFDKMNLVGILKLETKNYEYDWFEAFTPGEAQTRINHRANAGFHFRHALPFIQGLCETYDRNPSAPNEEVAIAEVFNRIKGAFNFAIGVVYIVERETGSPKRNEYRVLLGTWGRGKGVRNDLKVELDNSARKGFRPVAMEAYKLGNNHAVSILAELSEETPSETAILEYEIVVSESGFEKKVNNLSKNGFRLEFEGKLSAFRFALLQKTPKPKSTISYSWVDSTRKSQFEKFLGAVGQGIMYQGVSSQVFGCDYAKSNLLFEHDKNAPRSDIKIVKLTDTFVNTSLGRISGSPLSLNDEFGSLLHKNYVFRDLFYSDGINAILERVTK